MRDDEVRGVLRNANPWWAADVRGVSRTAWTAADVVLRDREQWDAGYRASILDDIASGPLTDGLYVLRGPRRVGKSVALKDLIANLLGRGDVRPMQVIYFAADTLGLPDLRRFFAVGRAVTASIEDDRRVWLVDEVTSVAGWTKLLKELRDNSPLADDCVIVTGSSALDSREAVRDLGAGRTRSAVRPFRTLLPMSFADFVRIRRPSLRVDDGLRPAELMDDRARTLYETWSVLVDDLDTLWQDYLEAGGFPRAVTEYTRFGGVSEEYLDELAAWLRTDVDPEAPAESVHLLLDQLVTRTAAPLNLRNTAETLGIGRDRLERRILRMRNTYAALLCPQRRDGKVVPGAQAKLYLTDPLLAQLPHRRRPGLNRADVSKLSEAALAVALARSVAATNPERWDDDDTVGYSRHSSGAEVDLAPIPVTTPTGDGWTVPIESKWVTRGWQRESRALRAAYGCGIVATKNITGLGSDVWAVPTPVLVLLMSAARDH